MGFLNVPQSPNSWEQELKVYGSHLHLWFLVNGQTKPLTSPKVPICTEHSALFHETPQIFISKRRQQSVRPSSTAATLKPSPARLGRTKSPHPQPLSCLCCTDGLYIIIIISVNIIIKV